MHCSNLGAQALNDAIKDYEEMKQGKVTYANRAAKKGEPKAYTE